MRQLPFRSPQARERLRAAVLYSVVGMLLTAALLLTGTRLLLASTPALRGELETLLAGVLEQEVSIGAVDARLDGLRPSLVLDDVVLGAGESRSRIRRLAVTVAPWGSLQGGELRLHRVTLAGAEITLTRTAAGELELAGLPPPQAEVPPRAVRLEDLRVTLVDAARDVRVPLADAALRMRRGADGLRVAFTAHHAGETGARLSARLAAADPERPLSGRAHVALTRWPLADALPWLPRDAPSPAPRAALDGEAWVDLDAARPTSLRAWLSATGLGLADGRIERASGDLHWQGEASDWTLALDRLAVRATDGSRRQLGPLRLARTAARDSWRAAADGLDLGLAAEVVRLSGQLPGDWASRLDRLDPGGRLESVAAVWRDGDWRLSGQLVGVATEPLAGWPGASGVSGRLDLGPRGGELDLAAREGALALPELFRAPLAYDRLAGRIAWYRPPDAPLRLQAEALEAEIDGARIEGRAGVWLDPEQGPFLDIRARARDGDAAHTGRYLPAGIMRPGLVRWLDRAIVSGQVREAELILFGPARRFPFGDGSGLFQVRGRAEDTRFAFHPDWPALDAVSGRLEFRNRGMRIVAEDGRIYGAGIAEASAEIEDLREPRLRVDGRVRGEGRELLRFLAESPLLRDPERLAPLRLEGETELKLALFLPFGGRPPQVDGRLDLTGTSAALTNAALRLDDLRGVVSFDEHGVSWDRLLADYAGKRVLSRARTEGEGEAARIRVDAVANLAPADLPGGDAVAERLQGRSEWLLRLERPGFRAPPGPTRVTVESALRGTAVEAPLRLGKPAGEARPSQLDVTVAPDGELGLELRYGERLQAAGRRPAGGELGLAVNLGDAMPSAPEQALLALGGELPPTRVAELMALRGLQGAGSAGELPPLQRVDLQLSGLKAAGWQLGETRLQARPEAGGWRLRVDGAASGTLLLPPDRYPVRADLERLALERRPEADGAAAAGEAGDEEAAAPAELPAGFGLDLETASLHLNGRDLGRLELTARAPAGALAELRASLAGSGTQLDLDGRGAGGEVTRSRLELELATEDAGVFLTALGLEDLLRGGRGEASARVEWDGDLLAPAVDSLGGEARLDLREGALPAVEPGAGRAVGLFSLSLLPRRLSLDFSDVVDTGLAFDRLEGRFGIADGVMTTERLHLDGPTASLRLHGSTDLAERRYDQWATVTPQLSATLPLIGGLAGGPVAAVVLLLGQDVIESGVDRLTRLTYRITGSWDNPRVTPVSARPADSGESADD